MTPLVYLSLGSNLGDCLKHIREAIRELQQLPNSTFQTCSSLYQTKAIGPGVQNDYINAVCCLHTTLAPDLLLQHLQRIEQQHQRVRRERWGPRTLDLDILLFADQQINSPALTIPHPGIQSRAFVLYPLQEIAPLLILPGLGALSDLLKQCPAQGIERLGV